MARLLHLLLLLLRVLLGATIKPDDGGAASIPCMVSLPRPGIDPVSQACQALSPELLQRSAAPANETSSHASTMVMRFSCSYKV